jgi:hypothetical protein
VKKGNEQETASLNINLKTINKTYLMPILERHENEAQTQIITEYLKDKANFMSTRRLFGAEKKGAKAKEPH